MTSRGVFWHSERPFSFFVILNELLGEEESLIRVCFDEFFNAFQAILIGIFA